LNTNPITAQTISVSRLTKETVGLRVFEHTIEANTLGDQTLIEIPNGQVQRLIEQLEEQQKVIALQTP
jgi:hypothetical protein